MQIAPDGTPGVPGTLVCDEDEIMEKQIVSGVTLAKAEAKITLRDVKDRPGVAAAVFGAGIAGVCRHADSGGEPRHDLYPNALFAQEERFLSARIEDKRVAPFQPDDDLPFASLVGEQIADRFLRDRLRRRRPDSNELRSDSRVPEQSRRHEVVMDDDVGGPQAFESTDGDQVRISGPCTHEKHARRDHGGDGSAEVCD